MNPAIKHGPKQFKPNTTVAAVIHCNGKFLFVEEYEEIGNTRKKVLNQPAGHVEPKESLIAACEREIYEETGLKLTPEYLDGIYYFYRDDIALHFLRFCFVIEVQQCLSAEPLDADIITTKWLTYDEIIEQNSNLRSAMVLECIDNYIENKKNNMRIPLSSLKTNI